MKFLFQKTFLGQLALCQASICLEIMSVIVFSFCHGPNVSSQNDSEYCPQYSACFLCSVHNRNRCGQNPAHNSQRNACSEDYKQVCFCVVFTFLCCHVDVRMSNSVHEKLIRHQSSSLCRCFVTQTQDFSVISGTQLLDLGCEATQRLTDVCKL